MKFLSLIFSVFLFICASCSAASPDPSHVKSELQHLPAKKVISNLKKHGEFEQILKRIDEGDAQWIALAPSLYRGTDAGDSEDIEIALATALPKNALAVLTVLNENKATVEGQPRIDKVCGVPFIGLFEVGALLSPKR